MKSISPSCLVTLAQPEEIASLLLLSGKQTQTNMLADYHGHNTAAAQ